MGIEFNPLQRKTLTAIVDTFVAAVPREDDPTGFYAAKGSDLGADVATESSTSLATCQTRSSPACSNCSMPPGLIGLKNQPQAVREAIIANLAGISPESAGAIAALYRLSVIFAYGLPDPQGHNPLWAGMGYPGPVQAPPQTPKTLHVITPSGRDDAGGGRGRGRLRQRRRGGGRGAGAGRQTGRHPGGRRLFNESDFVQLEPPAYQNLFLRGGFFPLRRRHGQPRRREHRRRRQHRQLVQLVSDSGHRSPLLGRTNGLTDVDTPAFDEHLQAVFDRISCNDKVATHNEPHQRLRRRAAKLGNAYRVSRSTSTRTDTIRS